MSIDVLADKRREMVDRQIAGRGITDHAVLDAMRVVPREAFVPEAQAEFAYDDTPLPIEAAQTISQPYIVALMASALELSPDDRVLEVGAGSGYAAAVLSRIAGEVHAIERHAMLAELARRRLRELGYDNAEVRHGDGTMGWPAHAPYDGIAVAAGGPSVPETLRQQLAVGGRLVIPVGTTPRDQQLIRVTRTSERDYREESLGAVRFVPLIGAQGWADDDPPPAVAAAAPSAERSPRLIREAAEPFGDME